MHIRDQRGCTTNECMIHPHGLKLRYIHPQHVFQHCLKKKNDLSKNKYLFVLNNNHVSQAGSKWVDLGVNCS